MYSVENAKAVRQSLWRKYVRKKELCYLAKTVKTAQTECKFCGG